MLMNDTIKSILERRSYKAFRSDPIEDEKLETIIEAAKYAPTGMNRQAWHFTVVRSAEGKAKFKAAFDKFVKEKGPFGPPPGVKMPPQDPNIIMKPENEMRGAPVMIIVSGDASVPTIMQDCLLATENLYISAASLGIMSGWSHMVTKDLFGEEEYCREFGIPEGYKVFSASFFGYPEGPAKDRGPRKEGTVTFI
ncbi:MAG: nitroreductase family protein [Oscillospiraceae bacterium]|jgi:nitroreductase